MGVIIRSYLCLLSQCSYWDCPLLLPKGPGLKDKLCKGDNQDTLAWRNWVWGMGISPWWWRCPRGVHVLKEWRRNLEREKMHRSRGRSHTDPKVSLKPFGLVVTPWSASILKADAIFLSLPACLFLFASFALQKILPTSTLLNRLVGWKGASQEQACISALPFPQALSFLAASWIPSWPQ